MRVFEPFFTTKEPRPRNRARSCDRVRHRRAERRLGHGRKPAGPGDIRVALQRVDADVEVEPGRGSSAAAAVTSRTILVVEDEHAVRSLLRRILEGLGHRVLSARDGAEALEIEAAHAGPIDLLVSDVIMPNMRGREIAERMGVARPGIGVLFVSGYPRDDIVRDGVLDPGVNFLQKPFDKGELVARVNELLNDGERDDRLGPSTLHPDRGRRLEHGRPRPRQLDHPLGAERVPQDEPVDRAGERASGERGSRIRR